MSPTFLLTFGYRYKEKGRILIAFKEQKFISIIRSETSTISEFISNCGGLLGLFMGASFLSIVELVYYPTLRLYLKLRRQTNQSVREIQIRRVTPASQADIPSANRIPAQRERIKRKATFYVRFLTVLQTIWKNLNWFELSHSKAILEDYCLNNSLHGIPYLMEPSRHLIERLGKQWYGTAIHELNILQKIKYKKNSLQNLVDWFDSDVSGSLCDRDSKHTDDVAWSSSEHNFRR